MLLPRTAKGISTSDATKYMSQENHAKETEVKAFKRKNEVAWSSEHFGEKSPDYDRIHRSTPFSSGESFSKETSRLCGILPQHDPQGIYVGTHPNKRFSPATDFISSSRDTRRPKILEPLPFNSGERPANPPTSSPTMPELLSETLSQAPASPQDNTTTPNMMPVNEADTDDDDDDDDDGAIAGPTDPLKKLAELNELLKRYNLHGHEEEMAEFFKMIVAYVTYAETLRPLYNKPNQVQEALRAAPTFADMGESCFICIGVKIVCANKSAEEMVGIPTTTAITTTMATCNSGTVTGSSTGLGGMCFFELLHPEDIMPFTRATVTANIIASTPPKRLIVRIKQSPPTQPRSARVIVPEMPFSYLQTIKSNLSRFSASLESGAQKYATCVMTITVCRDQFAIPNYSVLTCVRIDDLNR